MEYFFLSTSAITTFKTKMALGFFYLLNSQVQTIAININLMIIRYVVLDIIGINLKV